MTDEKAPVLETLAAQEEKALFSAFSELDAWRLGTILRNIALEKKAPVVIDVRTPDRTLFHAAMPGSAPDNDHWVRRKSNVCLRYHQSSLRVGEALSARGRSISDQIGVDPMDFAAHGGSFPIRLESGLVVAAVTVSGLPSLEDHRMIIAGLEAYLGHSLPAL